MMPAQQEAFAQMAAIAAAILRLGGTTTAAEIAGETRLPLPLVTRRLTQNGAAAIRIERRYFARAGDAWKLTEHGRALVEPVT